MAHYIVTAEYVPVRRSTSTRSERLYEFLFGEVLLSSEESGKWLKVVVPGREEEGWVLSDSVAELSEKQLAEYNSMVHMKVECNGLFVKRIDSYTTLLLPPCAVMPFYNIMTGTFKVADAEYEVVSPIYWNVNISERRDRIYRAAMCYLNAPFLYKGRTNGGIDDLFLVSNALSVAFDSVPKNLAELSKFGSPLSFIEEAQLGDILLFSDLNGQLSHCGMYVGNGCVLHAAGRVRVDKVDHQGVYNSTLKRYSFQLAGIVAVE